MMRNCPYLPPLVLLLILLWVRPSALDAGELPRLDDVVRAASKNGRYVATPPDELEVARKLFWRSLATDHPSDLAEEWAEIGMEVIAVVDPLDEDQQLWAIREHPSRKTGRGIYAIRPNAAVRYAIQMPHSFHDRHTRALGLYLFNQTPVTAAAWNTVERTQVDVAHVRFHYFNSFTSAFAETNPTSVIIQLHGFAQHKRTDPDAGSADCIVSNGTSNPPHWLGGIAAELNQRLSDYPTRLYPGQVSELGATKNHQGRLIHGASTASFLHVEMSQPLRRALRKEADLRDQFFGLILANCRH